MTDRILMRIDFQNDFVHPHGKLSIKNQELIEKHQRFADSLQAQMFDLILDSYDTHFEPTYPHSPEAQNYPPHCLYGTWGWQSAAPLKNNIEVLPVYKSTTDIWNEKNACRILSDSWRDKDVYLCGVLSDVCVVQAMNGLLKRGAKVTVLEDLCKGADYQIHEILQDAAYEPYISCGRLRTISTAQFFRAALSDQKIRHNLVHTTKGFNHE